MPISTSPGSIRFRLVTSFVVVPLMAVAMLSIAPARAGTVTVLFEEVGSDVRATLSGSFGLGTPFFSYGPTFSDPQYVDPSAAEYFSLTYAEFLQNNVDKWEAYPIDGPLSFGTGGLSSPSSVSGDPFGFSPGLAEGDVYADVYLPLGYQANQALSGVSTWSGTTLDAMGITPGTYTWTMGSDSFVVQAVAGVPEPSTYCMALAGLACGGYLMRRRKRA